MNLSEKSTTILAGLIITLATLSAYWNIQYNQFVYDDIKYLAENDYVRSGLSWNSITWALTATYDCNWFPLTWLSHMLDITLFGNNPLAHHLENLAIHIANALLLMGILVGMTGKIWRSAVVALLFALHPLHVESVVWAAERKDVLSTLFFLLTIRAYIGYTKQRTNSRYGAAIFLYLCGLAAKPMLVSLPFILLLLDFWPLRRFRCNRSSDDSAALPVLLLLREKIPFMLLSVASCIITYFVQKNGGAVNDAAAPPLLDNALHAFFNYATYLSKTFWPVDLGPLYPYVADLPVWMMGGAAALVLVLSLIAAAVHQRMPYATTGWFWFLVTTVPVAGFVRIGYHSVADRYTYIPTIGIFIVAVWLVADLLPENRQGKIIAALVTGAVLIPLAAVTWQQTTYWKDNITLFEHNLNVTGNNWVAHGNLGAELLKYNRTQEAILHLQEAYRINPNSYTTLFNIGHALNRLGNRVEALQAFRKVIELNPGYAEGYFEAGKTSFELGDRALAYEIQASLAQVNPDMAESLKKYFLLLEQIQLHNQTDKP